MADIHSDHINEKSRFMHGSVYHALWDRPLADARRRVADLLPAGSYVLDIACGTGELCFELAALRSCRILGVDLSRRMIEFARKRNRYDKVHFELGNVTNLAQFKSQEFDFATILFLLHEISRHDQVAVLNEARRVARKTIIVDSYVPFPRNLHAFALRLVEAMGGPQHYRSFADYLAAGGIKGILSDPLVGAKTAQSHVFWHGCREIVVLDGRP